MSLDYDPMSARWRDDPYPIYRRLRDEAPVHWAPESKTFCVSRYDDVQRVLNDPETFSSRAMFTVIMNGGHEAMPPLGWGALKAMVRLTIGSRTLPSSFMKGRNLIASDGAVHTQMRAIVNRGFSPRRIRDWEPRIRQVVDACMQELRQSDDFDVVRHLAVPLPVTLIAEMLGVEPARRLDFKHWSDTTIHYTTGSGRVNRFGDEFIDAVLALTRYLRSMLAERRKQPRDDLISVLLSSQDDDGQPLSDAEVIMFVNLLLVAGNETTTNLIGNAVNALLDHPAALERVAAEPALVPAVIEETLRFEPPIQVLFRRATGDAAIGDTPVGRGDLVAVLLASANRDERRFARADVFDVDRDTRSHLGFGLGIHFCLGASLARLEARVALEAIVPELPRLKVSGRRDELLDSFLVRGRRRLPLERVR